MRRNGFSMIKRYILTQMFWLSVQKAVRIQETAQSIIHNLWFSSIKI